MKNKEPLFHISKRVNISWQKSLLIKGGAILSALVLCCILLLCIAQANPFEVIAQMFLGNFGTPRRIWMLLKDMSLLLIVALALVPAFKMKFWNLGGNGQILMGTLASIICMFYMGNAGISDLIIVPCMIVCSILAGVIWAVIPAIFKAIFNTNESLFSLMLNYVASGLVTVFLTIAVKTGSGTLGIVNAGNLVVIGNDYMLTILVAIVIFGFMFSYLKYSKHGYELTVVGESEQTAKYIGINVRKVVIRTLVLSGAICGIVGLLIAGSLSHTVNTESANNMGFTAIMVTWLGKCNPLYMVGTSFLVSFLSRGMQQVQTYCGLTNNAISDIALGVMYFFIIGCDFFVNYKIMFRRNKKEEK